MADDDRERLDTAIALLRRALKRIDVLERRVAALDERQDWLDEIPEQMQALHRLARRASLSEEEIVARVMSRATNMVNKRMGKRG